MPAFLQQIETVERWRRLPGRERLDPGRGAVALTFDDGPDPDSTPAVLDALEAEGVRATFFMVGEQVERHGSLAREVADRGHEPALHGFLHSDHDSLSADEAHADLERGAEAVAAATGARPRRCRPPYGRFSAASHAACRELGLEPVYWSAWGLDWEPIPPERIADLVIRDLAAGTIVVLHDSALYAPRRSAADTARAVPAICAHARSLGLAITALS